MVEDTITLNSLVLGHKNSLPEMSLFQQKAFLRCLTVSLF